MGDEYERMMRRISAAKSNKLLWRSLHDECYSYFLPQKNLYDEVSPGQKKDRKVFDSTAEDALADYASRMEAQLVPPGRHWMILEAGTDVKEDEAERINPILEKITEIVFNHITSSNFSSQINEAFLDLGISTGAIICEEGDGIQSSLRFRAVPLAELILEKSSRGIVETVWREITLNAADIKHTFPKISIPEDIEVAISEKPESEWVFIEGVALSDDEGSYISMVISEKHKDFLYYEKELSSPWVVFRESTTAGEVYGRGRAIRALPDTQTLNELKKDYLSAVEIWSNPTYLAEDDGVINPHTSTFKPRTINVVGSVNSVGTLPPSGEPSISMELMRELQGSIRRTMLSKPFGNIEETPVRTATEMSIRNADLAETSMSASGRIENELLERLVQRAVYILGSIGKLPKLKVNGRELSIKFTSPAAKAQDAANLVTVLRFMEILQGLPPELINMSVKVEEIPKEISDMLGVSKNLIRTSTERKVKEKEMQDQQQALLAQQQG